MNQERSFKEKLLEMTNSDESSQNDYEKENGVLISDHHFRRLSSRTSTPILEKKFSMVAFETKHYRKWCEDLEKPFPERRESEKGTKKKFLGSIISGILLPVRDKDIANRQISEENFRNKLSTKIFKLFNGSFKTFIKKTSSLLKIK